MPERRRSYQSIPDMAHEPVLPVLWKFLVYCTGITNGTHQSIVQKLKDLGQIMVQSFEDCDYLLVFCPITSRVGTDIGEAMYQVNQRYGNKPIILVVMHHTFNTEYVVAKSGRHVENTNVFLTVDTLFYENRLLNCNRNDIALDQIRTYLPVSKPSWFLTIINWGKRFIKPYSFGLFSIIPFAWKLLISWLTYFFNMVTAPLYYLVHFIRHPFLKRAQT